MVLEMSARRDEDVRLVPESMRVVVRVLERHAHVVVDEEHAEIGAHVPIAEGVHVVEEGEVTRGDEAGHVRVDEAGP